MVQLVRGRVRITSSFKPQCGVRFKRTGKRKIGGILAVFRDFSTEERLKMMLQWRLNGEVILRRPLIAKVGRHFLLLLSICLFLTACAHSNVARDTAANIDLGVRNAKRLFYVGDGDIADAYGNTNQTTKGALIGGTAGGLIGLSSSGIGFFAGATTGALLGASYGAYIDSQTYLADRLDNRGTNIIVLGDQVLIVIPSARLFYPYSATIKPQAFSTLTLVARYINRFTKMLVKISAYTADTGACTVDSALSQLQANNVEKFLTASRVDARVLYATGYGGSRIVSPNSSGWDSDNYRIEITLEKIYI